MCGRFMFDGDAASLRADFQVALRPDEVGPPRYNLAPQQRALVLTPAGQQGGALVGRPMRFGWRPPSGTPRMVIDARLETAAVRPMFAQALRSARCVVPARAFFEWAPGPAPRQPWRFGRRDGRLFALAALALPAAGAAGEEGFVILTTAANAVVAPVHGRMPLMLAAEQAAAFVAGAALGELLPAAEVPADAILAHPVSRLLNSPRNDRADIVAPPRDGSPALAP